MTTKRHRLTALRRILSRRGSALLIVLACLVILAAMILALLGSISSDVQTSKVYATGSSVKLLSESAVNLVMSEIRDATANEKLCWAAQPGMIRTYDNAGAAVSYYKLYSDGLMVGPGVFDHTLAQNTVPPDWYQRKGEYVDLNQPVAVPDDAGGTSNQYPILDGDMGQADLVSGSSVDASAGVPVGASVLGPLYADTTQGASRTLPQVSGFWLNSPTAAKRPTPVDPDSPNQAPMPVKWLYVLEQGQVIAPDSGAAGQPITFNTSNVAPSSTNPIAGRIAFWTDDETSKINLNTASESALVTDATGKVIKSSFIDTPRVSTVYDLNLAFCPAWQNEFQRYPGHPATVSLSSVFGSLTTDPNYPEMIYSASSTVTGLAPRTISGGSQSSTVKSAGSGAAAMGLLGNRLYATPDEFFFKPSMTGTPGVRVLNSTSLSSAATLSQQALQRAQFFVTCSSRAPDVNLFNLPRVNMWPVSSDLTTASPYATAYDRLIAFCTTVGKQPYYFQRTPNPNSQPDRGYLGQTEWSDIARNQALLSYLGTLGSTNIPGFGGTFSGKYDTPTGTGTSFAGTAAASEFDQILMEVYDYIRITNMCDSSLASGANLNQYCRNSNTNNPGGEVVPSYDASRDVKGFGRFATISKVGILFIGVADSTMSAAIPPVALHPQYLSWNAGAGTYGPPVPKTAAGADQVRVQASLVFSLFDPAEGFTGYYPGCTLKVTACTLTWDYGPLFPHATNASVGAISYATQGWGGNLGFDPLRRNMAVNYSPTANFFSPLPGSSTDTNNLTDFPSTGQIHFNGGDLTVQLQKGSTVVQTMKFHFPAGNFSMPSVGGILGTPVAGLYISPGNLTDLPGDKKMCGRFNLDSAAAAQNNYLYYWVSSRDTLQSLQSVNGDLRLIAGRRDISDASTPSSSTLFGPHPLWGSGSWAHSYFQNILSHPVFGATRGQLVASSSVSQFYWQMSGYTGLAVSTPFFYSGNLQNSLDHSSFASTCEPEGWGTGTVPAASKGGTTSGDNKNIGWSSGNAPGDWDNGIGSTQDGPYINKPDEGLFTDSNAYPAYFTANKYDMAKRVGATYFSPARQMPSPAMLGSLPTGVIANRPWQTLLFQPDPTGKHAGSANRKGDGSLAAGAPPDHLLLDLFTMPVVEPYAISEPLSTSGRINMNCLIVPFTYINRDTGIRSILASQQMVAIPNSFSKKYKQDIYSYTPSFTGAAYPFTSLRVPINAVETLKGFQARFYPSDYGAGTSPDIFRSPSEICTLFLAPGTNRSGTPVDPGLTFGNSPTVTSMAAAGRAWWETHQVTGDNSRERPYANIYPLLTTKSNTFTIHFRVQTLKQVTSGNPARWREGTDAVTGEYRGSQTVERFVDPGDGRIPDYASNPQAKPSLASLYKFRVISNKQFAP